MISSDRVGDSKEIMVIGGTMYGLIIVTCSSSGIFVFQGVLSYTFWNVTRNFLEKDTLVEEPISPDMRIAITLYRLGRGDYIHTIAKLFGVGDSTVCGIVVEVCNVIIKFIWDDVICFPKSAGDFKKSIKEFERLWQFPYCFDAIDGCHLPIKCPPGGQEYHNFKNFYSIVWMAIVGSDYQFLWASCGIHMTLQYSKLQPCTKR